MVRVPFEDVTAGKLAMSTWRVFRRISALQGPLKASRVFPIIWTIIKAVRGFSEFHEQELTRMLAYKEAGLEPDDLPLPEEDNERYRQLGSWLCQKLYSLGPTFVKIGQTLSTRADLLPLSAMLELSKLQEDADAFPTEVALATIESELGGKISELYSDFDKTPIAAASLSQAYQALLKDGRKVVVKVQRPNLPQLIANDVQVLAAIADEVMTYPSLCRRGPGICPHYLRRNRLHS